MIVLKTVLQSVVLGGEVYNYVLVKLVIVCLKNNIFLDFSGRKLVMGSGAAPYKSQGSSQKCQFKDGTGLLSIFYPKETLNGKRLHELDQDIIEAITGMYV